MLCYTGGSSLQQIGTVLMSHLHNFIIKNDFIMA